MEKQNKSDDTQNLPPSATIFIERVVKKMRYRRSIRRDVRAELTAHFQDGLKECSDNNQREQAAIDMIADFGDIKLLALLLRRAKRRCRPLWRTAVARTFQTIGILLLFLILYAIWFSAGSPTIEIDYTAILNNMNHPQLLEEDNAWPYYQKAIDLFVKPHSDELTVFAYGHAKETNYRSADLTDEQLEGIQKWISNNEDAWNQFKQASAKSYCYRQYMYDPNTDQKWLLSILLPHLGDLRDIAKLGIWRSRIDAENRQLGKALENCLTVAAVGPHWQNKGILIEQLVGLSINRLAAEQIMQILQEPNVPIDLLEATQRKLERIYPAGYPLTNIEGERLMFLDTVQHLFTKGGIGGGHLIPGKWVSFSDTYLDSIEGQDKTVMMPFFAAQSMIHARRDETLAIANKTYDQQAKWTRMTPYARHKAKTPSIDEVILSHSRHRFFLLYDLMPAFGRAAELAYQGKATHQATIAILALKRWKIQKNRYPGTLDELVSAGLLQNLPMDPYSDKPLVYKTTADGFLLYSVGPNFEDDGGQQGKTEKGIFKNWRKNGDTVFWPIPQSNE
ncbi:MAG: hypothetical protein JW720_07970 [Sedimentisphaerales bacterium]|nr:hypothetical protein [Sedimentisphaerales bacterium]